MPGVGSPAQPWRQVAGDGFTFCVPPDWLPIDSGSVDSARAWGRDGSYVQWSPGYTVWSVLDVFGWRDPAPRRILLPPEYEGRDPSTFASSIIRNPLPPQYRPLGEREVRTEPTVACVPRRQLDTLEGWTLALTRADCGLRHHTSASWQDVALRFDGSAVSDGVARQQVAVYRTVRFVERPPSNLIEPG